GQFLKIQILAGEQEAFLVPQSAVIQNEQGHTVWIAEDGKAGPRAIKTANWVGSDWIVTEGLKAGDTVITDNIMKLRPGIAVEPRKMDAAAASPAAAAAEKPAAGR
ncbi:MAG: efflux transporter periplasmic adaptor subunit, partial [Burkholderiales bacterium]|nr:efflux transporter periplasmic adaptor subunit [Burkholderiales bacterium]